MKKPLLFIVLLLTPLRAAQAGGAGADFLQVPAGARPAAMGGAYAAVGTDAYSPVWNPAGIGFLAQKQIALQHLSYLDSVRYEFSSLALPVFGAAGVAFSVRDMASGSIPGTDIAGNTTSDFSTRYSAYSLSYGQAVTSSLSLGVTGALISAKLADISASAYSFDMGMIYRPTDKVSLALVGVNFGNKLTFIKEGDALPSGIKLEAAYKPFHSLTLAAGGTYRLEGPTAGRAGLEFQPLHGFLLRAGYKTDGASQLSGVTGMTAGAGFQIMGHEVSYAWVPFGDLGDTHYVSMVLKFGSVRKDTGETSWVPVKNPRKTSFKFNNGYRP